ncbi:NAPDH-dependent diflavin reductase [Steccherinum ochraceum]|uniref:NADPH-dependent diflavin oxidoreductase 1 n=1 Tax=Steccherinum ochraceum TaxID=92696 RepID=A0A4R0REP7_9APHY|nr:NAPDH-dependent diflavin reductase [Steccherinum ochraceum]
MSLDVLDDEHSPFVTILYATETGTAQDVAERLAHHCRRLHLTPKVFSVDAYSPEDIISETFIIFIISTTGSGKEPRSLTPLWTMLLRSDLPNDLFEDLDFAVFGLGDTAYEKFCWPAKLLSRRLVTLGAQEICERGEGDDQHQLGIDGAFEPWKVKLSEALLQIFPLPPDVEPTISDEALPPPRVTIVQGEKVSSGDSSNSAVDLLLEDKRYHNATLARFDRITASDWYQDVRHIEFDFGQDVKYSPGDVAVIHPELSAAHVDSFLISVGYANTADDLFTVEHTLRDQSLPDHMPRTVTLRQLFTRYLDISAVPRRSFFALLRHFVSDELEKEKIDEFLSPEGADLLYEYTQLVHRSIREVIEEFRSAKIPREYVFDLFPPLRPREFSIASSMHRFPRKLQLCIAIVKYRTKLKIPRRGVATTYLSSLQIGDTIPIGIKKGGLINLPADLNTPIICVGPGTGIAPVRAVVEERSLLGAKDSILYQGCRSALKDQYYKAEFEKAAEDGTLTYRVACSRDGPEGVKRTYVQDLIGEDGEKIWDIVGKKQGWLYISGSSNKMPAGVRAAVREAVVKYGGKTEEDAADYVAAMEREGRLIEDCWS